MEEKDIKVIIKEVDKPAEIKIIPNKYEELSRIVDGMIDVVQLPGCENVDIFCNDEYLLNGSKANVMNPEYDNVFCGTIIFAGLNPDDGSTISLTDAQIEHAMKYIDKYKVNNMDVREAYFAMQMLKTNNPNATVHSSEAESE